MNFADAKDILIRSLKTQIQDERVLSAIYKVPRELFVPERLQSLAYADEPLPIAENQTISQPLIVAMMTQALELKGKEKILEIGTGSGYQTAILAELAGSVVTTERVASLSASAQELLNKIGYTNISFHVTKDELGWDEGAPYVGIIVTAGTPKVPQALLNQLAIGGRMVIPVGPADSQILYQINRLVDRFETCNLGGVRFVPLIGNEAWQINNK